MLEARGGDPLAEAAFREIVNRHGPMVMGVCRQILRNHHDADDAFQATFLVLVRKANSIRVDDSLAPWLCSVAYRTACRARELAARYRSIDEVEIEEPVGSCLEGTFQFDLRPLLHEELDRLPGKFRDAIVLCHLEGKSHEEAARLLQAPIGTVNSRLSRGRRLLRRNWNVAAWLRRRRYSQRIGWPAPQPQWQCHCSNRRLPPPSGRRRRKPCPPWSCP